MWTNPMKLVLAAVVALLIAAGFYILDWRQRWEEVAHLDSDLQQRQLELESSRKAIQDLPQLTQKLEQLEAQLRRLVTTPSAEEPSAFVANYVSDIERLVLGQRETTGDDSFSIVSITPGPPAETSADAPKNPQGTPEALKALPTRVFQMQMTGRFETLTGFLEQLAALKLDRLVTINRISLSPQGKDDGQGPILSVTIPITAYLRQGGPHG